MCVTLARERRRAPRFPKTPLVDRLRQDEVYGTARRQRTELLSKHKDSRSHVPGSHPHQQRPSLTILSGRTGRTGLGKGWELEGPSALQLLSLRGSSRSVEGSTTRDWPAFDTRKSVRMSTQITVEQVRSRYVAATKRATEIACPRCPAREGQECITKQGAVRKCHAGRAHALIRSGRVG